ncbi:MAG: 1-(5-phosphoribosyl)-5-[(5-phosphoribosylamino) methylideneamino] imidazole-4-carboxamide isomerase [Actinomycetota bacterium]|nr:MAG: 1-(5-phosphoribosyl)-5-[(5-phosphoribosylamino) methylideneamino] imidazole-4-carboxamide isomerase [Actinomycetota bacterium]
MIVIPAIDLRRGRAVRLLRGDPEAQTVYDDDPVALALRFQEEGARRLHVVDLDAALGEGDNRPVIERICRSTQVPVQVGGGIRDLEAIERALGLGAKRVVLGTRAALDPAFVARAVEEHAEKVVVAVDVRAGRVMVRGWREEGPPLQDAIEALEEAGAPRYLVTSIARDGTLDGPDLRLYQQVLRHTQRPVIASGGVRTADDIWALREVGCEAAVTGKALYEGTLRIGQVTRGQPR